MTRTRILFVALAATALAGSGWWLTHRTPAPQGPAGDVMPPKSEKPLTERQKEALYAFVEGQPIPAELASGAAADTKAAAVAAKEAASADSKARK